MVTENTAPNAAADVEMSQYVADRTRVNEDKIKKDDEIISQFGDYNYGWHDSDAAGEAAKRGIDENVVRAISADKGEPQWMLDMRLRGFKAFLEKPMPDWGVDLSGFNADDFKYYVKPIDKQAKSWDELPDDIRNTYDRLGIPEAEKNRLVSGGLAPKVVIKVLSQGDVGPVDGSQLAADNRLQAVVHRCLPVPVCHCLISGGNSAANRIEKIHSLSLRLWHLPF